MARETQNIKRPLLKPEHLSAIAIHAFRHPEEKTFTAVVHIRNGLVGLKPVSYEPIAPHYGVQLKRRPGSSNLELSFHDPNEIRGRRGQANRIISQLYEINKLIAALVKRKEGLRK